MRLLIDSHTFLWILGRPEALSNTARQALGDRDNERVVSVASLWEIGIKVSTGKLIAPMELDAAVPFAAATVLPISTAHIKRVQALPFHHRDPFDRMMIAQAIEEGLTIVTRDRIFAAYGMPVLTA
ncbi:MAG: type II toxin-antitoxin system VapC family toxin [Reyranella sp.]|uniref:type II toxin-antitoxin system VapC family toxin n=1 Tax=Reyranella sp. TaxID=1929291 RepID=UPI001AD49C4E|nr:type II toxin-antitoxin system VapC family toxin [Reyranella sp.]MBN9089871.1 type II toxin-antitoxin system VapC family toxin [Reyranella sp.]